MKCVKCNEKVKSSQLLVIFDRRLGYEVKVCENCADKYYNGYEAQKNSDIEAENRIGVGKYILAYGVGFLCMVLINIILIGLLNVKAGWIFSIIFLTIIPKKIIESIKKKKKEKTAAQTTDFSGQK